VPLSAASSLRTAAALGAGILALAGLAGCGHHNDATPAPGPDGPACTVSGFAQDAAYTVTSSTPTVGVIGTFDLPKGLGYPAQLGKSVSVLPQTPKITMTTGSALSPTDQEAVLGSAGAAVKHRAVVDDQATTLLLKGGSTEMHYVVYVPMTVVHGTFTMKGCGATYNDGSAIVDLAGSYVTYQQPGAPLVTTCGDKSAGAVAEAAQRLGC